MPPTDCRDDTRSFCATRMSPGRKKVAVALCAASTAGRAVTTEASEARTQSTIDGEEALASDPRMTGRPRWLAANDTDDPLVTRAKATTTAAITPDRRNRQCRGLTLAFAMVRCAPVHPTPPPASSGSGSPAAARLRAPSYSSTRHP